MPRDWVLLHAGALGDLALALQVALRVPGIRRRGALTIYSSTSLGELHACTPAIRGCSLDALRASWLFGDSADARPAALVQALRGRAVISALGDSRTRVHERLSQLALAALYSYDPRPRADLAAHITQQWTSDLAGGGLLVEQCVARRRSAVLRVPDALRARGAARLETVGVTRSACLIHPGSGGRAKCWPAEAFVAAARLVRARAGIDVAFVLGPVEQERMSVHEIASLRRVCSVLTPMSAGELTELLAAAAVLLSNDSGPAHLAALLGAPTVTLFGPTRAARWRPLGPAARVLQGDPAQGAAWGLNAEQATDAACASLARSPRPTATPAP
ncbi:MAG: glycosyltransferase family 9 protein [Phycisphaerae bacterium]